MTWNSGKWLGNLENMFSHKKYQADFNILEGTIKIVGVSSSEDGGFSPINLTIAELTHKNC